KDDADLDTSLGFYEAYGQFSGSYGQFRAGLIPTGFGINGRKTLGELDLPRPMFLAQRWVTLRDYGMSYEIDNRHYFTTLAIHNGEVTENNEDQETWYTGSWGWRDEDRFQIVFSGQTGGTNAASTGSSHSTLGMFDPTKSAHWRMGVAGLHWHDRRFT